jgi:hypothetical protein
VVQSLQQVCAHEPDVSSPTIKKRLKEQRGLDISVTHLNRTRTKYGWNRQVEQKKREIPSGIKMEQPDCCW